jgi:NAD(P)-dependent dehydrogenase (short-subunit alcohol dehydrogenase family)
MLDITNEAEIASLVKHIKDDPERRPLRALVNNAGIVVEPGAVTTEMSGRVGVTAERITDGMTTEQRGRYATLMHLIVAQAQTAIRKALPAEKAGRVIADAITSKRPRTRYTVGRDAAIIVGLARCLSDRMLGSLLARSLKPHLPKALPTA